MKLWTVIIVLFIILAIGIGISVRENSDLTPNNITDIIDDYNMSSIELNAEDYDNVYARGVVDTLEYYIKFVVFLGFQVMKLGIIFGYENPDYFEPSFILNLLKLILIALVIVLLIKPVTYLVIIIVLFVIWIKDRVVSRRIKREEHGKKVMKEIEKLFTSRLENKDE